MRDQIKLVSCPQEYCEEENKALVLVAQDALLLALTEEGVLSVSQYRCAIKHLKAPSLDRNLAGAE